jgi:hypothetical protein
MTCQHHACSPDCAAADPASTWSPTQGGRCRLTTPMRSRLRQTARGRWPTGRAMPMSRRGRSISLCPAKRFLLRRTERGRGPAGGYVRLNQGTYPIDRAELLTQLTGRPAKSWDIPTEWDNQGRSPDKQLLEEFRNRLSDNKPILVGTLSRQEDEPPLAKDLVSSHAYEVINVDDKGMIHVRNPYNRRHPEPLTTKEFRENIRRRYTTLEQ